MPEQLQPLAPVYRYFVADLLTNRVLAEIPFRGVKYGRLLKATGKFSGRVPILEDKNGLDLYNNTMPGQTALYAVRNGVCVWGGIIWARDYNRRSGDLSISASEFASYLHHRRIWKTWNHEYGGTLAWTRDRGWSVVYDTGSSAMVKPGSTVHIEFYEVENFKYNGHYRVAGTPLPTAAGFSIESGFAVADFASLEIRNGIARVYTKENHGYTTGDVITVEFADSSLSGMNRNYQIEAPAGSKSNYFEFVTGEANRGLTPLDGTARRPLPQGTYTKATITVRSDAYDYIRTLVASAFADFMGVDFPNTYIEPGVSYPQDVINKSADFGAAILETAEPHGLAVGQAVQIKDVDRALDGEWEVQNVISPTRFAFLSGSVIAPTAMGRLKSVITALSSANGQAIFTTGSPHGYKVGNIVTLQPGPNYPEFDGAFKIVDVPSSNTFTVNVSSTNAYPPTSLPQAQITVSGKAYRVDRAQVRNNYVTLTLRDRPEFALGASAQVVNVNKTVKIVEKSLDAPNSVATIQTDTAHGFSVGQNIQVSGLRDAAEVVSRSTNGSTVTLVTSYPHNFHVGGSVDISGVDRYRIVNKSLSGNVATITTDVNHTMSSGSSVTIENVKDVQGLNSWTLVDDLATITTSGAHNFKVNDKVEIIGAKDNYRAVAKTIVNGVAILTMDRPHNVLEGDKIVVSGIGAPFDGNVTVTLITDSRVYYNIDQKWADSAPASARNGQNVYVPADVPDTAANGNVFVETGYVNGEWTISSTTSNTFSFSRLGNDVLPTSLAGTSVTGPSVMNGVYTITGVGANTFSFAKTANNSASASVPLPDEQTGEAVPRAYLPSVHSGTRTITAITPNSITFDQGLTGTGQGGISLAVTRNSNFNGVRTITSIPSSDRFTFTMAGERASVVEQTVDVPAFAASTSIYNGSFLLSSVDLTTYEVSYARSYKDVSSHAVQSRGDAEVRPEAIMSTFGPFPGNANIGMDFQVRNYSGINLTPILHRGFELVSVGEALDKYSDSINGFEYRIDCRFDPETETFGRTFVLMPIQLPNPPAAGEVSPLERFGADKLVFEYPGGGIIDFTIEESAENSATRFFASGTTDLGDDFGPPIGVASADDLLHGEGGTRKWPLLDDSEDIKDIEDKNVLYDYAKRYLSEARPPSANLTLSVNGSVPPLAGTYGPGDWASLIIDDPFVQMRLASGLERRTDVLLRKISAIDISVPDGVTAPETISLTLVPEWEVDTLGK